LCLPDGQVKPGVPISHWTWAGEAICDYRPDVVVNLGDFWDMASLSSHDKPGSKYFENKRFKDDVEAGNEAMQLLLKPLKDLQGRQKKNKDKVYKPRMVFLRGNHEARLARAVQNNPILEGTLSYDALDTKDWEVSEFLHPVFINGVGFNHYWPVGAMDRPAASPAAIIQKLHMSCVAGHQQGKQIAYGKRADGKGIFAIIAGSYYQHEETYLSKLGNSHWQGIFVLNEVQDGQADELFLSMDYLKRKYG
jgi:hypothetical protein